jgi:hypothetical protein
MNRETIADWLSAVWEIEQAPNLDAWDRDFFGEWVLALHPRLGLPGYQLWTKGATRIQMQTANQEAGRACYCASLWNGHCDACTGLAPEGGQRWSDLVQDSAHSAGKHIADDPTCQRCAARHNGFKFESIV